MSISTGSLSTSGAVSFVVANVIRATGGVSMPFERFADRKSDEGPDTTNPAIALNSANLVHQ
jgi:hypothetical protein